jgi:hypothetical protein
MSEKVFEHTGERVSATTLQRFLGLVKSKSSPFKSTLNILSVYAGFKDWEDFCVFQKGICSNDINDKGVIPDASAFALLNICLKNGSFHSVAEYLDILHSKYEKNPFFPKNTISVPIGNLIGKYVRENREGAEKLLPLLARSERGREYFFESFVDVDYLDVYFADALDFYDKYSKDINTIQGRTEYIFSNCIRLLNYWERGDLLSFDKLSENLFKELQPENVSIHNCLHIKPVARYHSMWLIYNAYHNKLSEKDIARFLVRMQNMIEQKNFPNDVLMHTLYALHHSNLYDHLISFYQENLSWFLNEPWHDETTPLVHSFAFHSYQVMGLEFPIKNISSFFPKKEPYFLCSAKYIASKVNQLTVTEKEAIVA